MADPDTSFADQTVLVTGASGFIGSHLCRSLLAAGAVVHALSRSETPMKHERLRHWRTDMTDALSLGQAVATIQPKYVFHLASHVQGSPKVEHVLPAFKANLESTVHLLLALNETQPSRVVLAGSLVEPAPGDPEHTPSSPYAAAKWASAQYARMFHALYGLPTLVARVFMVYGPNQRDLTKLVPYTILSLLKGESPQISSGQRLVDWVYVDDVVDGLKRLATVPGIEGMSVDLGSGEVVTTREIVEIIHDLMGVETTPQFGALPDRPLEPVRKADIARSLDQIGWAPRVDLRQGLLRTIESYRTNSG